MSKGEEAHGPSPEATLDWSGPTDPQNPMNWTAKRRWLTIALVTAVTLVWYG